MKSISESNNGKEQPAARRIAPFAAISIQTIKWLTTTHYVDIKTKARFSFKKKGKNQIKISFKRQKATGREKSPQHEVKKNAYEIECNNFY